MRSKIHQFFCLVIAAGSSIGWAAENSVSGVNVGELAIVQSQTILLKAQAERAQAERSINGDDNHSTAQSPASFSPQGLLPSPITATRATDTQQQLPVVKAIFGSARRLRATLLYSSGFEVDADASTRELPGGYRVANLTVDSVTLERDGKRFPLGFSNVPPGSTSSTNNPVSSSIPSATTLPGFIQGQR
ncbi:type IV pilus biogenesis protein PilP [Pseudomonas sp. AP19]|uniref:type IV pilus biogenesis protein PilP n=1 Tax=Pseudomonas sp. AP19 TaxID=1535623 RepID=UPI00084B5BAE|nr:type IV pilus biogenesis protein PilP [Pseudomonas sp. AP19]OEC62935.1 pilus assembly protein PilP [Pseudomonas sp. AP19]